MGKFAFYISDLHCQNCGALFSLPRRKKERRKSNHIKHIYCIHCGKRTPHIENLTS